MQEALLHESAPPLTRHRINGGVNGPEAKGRFDRYWLEPLIGLLCDFL